MSRPMSAGMTVEEIEKMATACVRRGNIHDSGPRIIDLARFVLAVLPVVRAAEAWRETEASDLTYEPFARLHLINIGLLKVAVDAMRAATEGK